MLRKPVVQYFTDDTIQTKNTPHLRAQRQRECVFKKHTEVVYDLTACLLLAYTRALLSHPAWPPYD